MSSIVSKFAPKAKQRRSTTGTPIASRRPSVTPTPDTSRRSIDASFEDTNNKAGKEEDDENSDDDDEDDGPLSKPSTIEMPKPQETKQRRLSTLSNISNRDIFKKVSVQNGYTHDATSSSNADRKTHIIGIPQPPAPVKRRRSTVSQSRRGSALKRKSVSEVPGATPPASAAGTATPSAASSVPPPPILQKVSEKEAPVEKPQVSRPTTIETTSKDKGENDEPLSPTSSSQDPFTSSLPIPSTLPSSLPSTAQDGSKSQKTSETPVEQQSRPVSAPEASRPTVDNNASKEQSPMPIGIPIIRRPFTAPTLSKAEGKAPEDDTAASSPAPQAPPHALMMKIRILTSFQAKKYDQLSKNFSSINPELSQHITIDEESFTIQDLCKPTLPIGKVSSNFHQAQEARKSKMKQRKEKRELRRLAKENKVSLESLTDKDRVKKETKKEGEEGEGQDDEPEEEQKVASSSNAAIQLKVGADGNLIVDEDSRLIDRHVNIDNDTRERYNQNPFENVVNSASYGKQRYTDKWDENEVLKFYRALGQWGTDFGLIAQMFPHRTRRQVKAKFILEEKKETKIDANKTFGTLNDFNTKLEQLKKDHEENLKELSIAREKAKEEDLIRQKKRELEVKSGQGTRQLTRQERLLELRKHETVLGSIDDIKKQREEEEAAAAAAALS
ncbi:unnamed protein product [Wickerhamomyces anomalus]